MWPRRLLAQTPVGPVRKPDIHDPGSTGSSCDETFTFSFVFLFFVLFSPLLPCCPTLQMSFVGVDPVIFAACNKAPEFVLFLADIKAVQVLCVLLNFRKCLNCGSNAKIYRNIIKHGL